MNWIALIEKWWKVAVVAAYTAFVFAVAWHVRGVIAESATNKAIEAQIEADNAKQASIEAVAKDTEAKLLTEQEKNASLLKRWSSTRAETHTSCKLDSDVIGLLRDATAPDQLPR